MVKIYLTEWQAELVAKACEEACNWDYGVKDRYNQAYTRVAVKIRKAVGK